MITVHDDTTRVPIWDDPIYDMWVQRIQARFLQRVDDGLVPLFTTNVDGLFQAFLEALPQEHRQYHTCHACRHFLERFGGLITIQPDGSTRSAIWEEEDAPALYRPAVQVIARLIRRSTVTGVFLSADKVWGQPVTGSWHHVAVTPPGVIVFTHPVLSASQAIAEKRQDYVQMQTALQVFTLETVQQAVTLLKTESLYRSEKCLGVAEWLAQIHQARREAKGASAREHLIWLAVAQAPPGFCHPRSSMIGTLLEDITAGLPFNQVSRRFAEKMHPLQYQRPQTAPSLGNIAQAEQLAERLGITASLRRRYARLDEVEAIWWPTPRKDVPHGIGVFAHLTPKLAKPAKRPMALPLQTMTWAKFSKTILPEALAIEYFIPDRYANYTAMVTAADPAAPPILQWDDVIRRNPVSSYVWNGGSPAAQWGLISGRWHKVTAITHDPAHWGAKEMAHQGLGVILLLEGAKESRMNTGLALFPETLKSELYAVRATIEAYSNAGMLEGREDASACGIALSKGSALDARVLVHTATALVEYRLDRWD